MTNIVANVDFNKETGRIKKALHASNVAPQLSDRNIYDFTPRFKEMNFYASRTHDWALWNPGQRMIDTHFIFPLFKEDPKDPTHYFFDSSDEMIQMCLNTGTKVFYRLGTSIEHTGGRHFNAVAPTDFEKYAEILAGIVRHYNHGWANGFHHNIEYWEVWCEPDGTTSMWDRGFDGYIPFFITVFKRLKQEFPEIKVGGPALCWFNKDCMDKFCIACKDAQIEPDFLSWHCYTADAVDLIRQPAHARKILNRHGFPNTEISINEWHYLLSWQGLHYNVTPDLYRHAIHGPAGMSGIESAAFNLAVLCGWQETPLDSAYYYGGNIDGSWGFRTQNLDMNKNFYSMKMFGTLIADFPKKCFSESKCNTVFTLAGKSEDGKRCALLISDYRGCSRTLDIEINGMEDRKLEVYALDDNHDFTHFNATYLHGNILTLAKERCSSSAYLLVFE